MPMPALVENLRTLIVSHKGHDEAGFRRGAEAIIRELNIENRPGEARSLREALGAVNGNGQSPAAATQLSLVMKPANGLITTVDTSALPALFFSCETDHALARIVTENRESCRLAEAGLKPKSRLLFWGPPGCGKTAAASWLAAELSIPLGVVRVGALITSFVGETGANLQRVLAMAAATPMVLLIDEADAVAKSREDAQDVGELRRIVNALLQGLDAFTSRRSVIVFASNHSHVFDAAVWRRFDDVVSFPLPGKAERLKHLRHLTNGLRLTGNLITAAGRLDGSSYADIERAVHEVAKGMVLSQRKTTTVAEIVSEAKKRRAKLASANGQAPRRARRK